MNPSTEADAKPPVVSPLMPNMRARDALDLLLLAALWGASFLFMRIAVPSFGPMALAEVRVVIAALFLLGLMAARGGGAALLANARPLAAVGVLNSALPFVLFSYGTITLTAGFAAILNAATPLWTALIAWLWLRSRIRPLQWLGLAIGVAGVGVLTWGKIDFKPGASEFAGTLAIAACLLATMSYGVAANLTKRQLAQVDSLAVATGSQCGAALSLAPLAIIFWPTVMPGGGAWLATITLAIACTGVAYILYFRLIARIGAMRAASVTFLIPPFATVWGAMFLGEALTTQMIAGGAVILAGIALALGLVGGAKSAALQVGSPGTLDEEPAPR